MKFLRRSPLLLLFSVGLFALQLGGVDRDRDAFLHAQERPRRSSVIADCADDPIRRQFDGNGRETQSEIGFRDFRAPCRVEKKSDRQRDRIQDQMPRREIPFNQPLFSQFEMPLRVRNRQRVAGPEETGRFRSLVLPSLSTVRESIAGR